MLVRRAWTRDGVRRVVRALREAQLEPGAVAALVRDGGDDGVASTLGGPVRGLRGRRRGAARRCSSALVARSWRGVRRCSTRRPAAAFWARHDAPCGTGRRSARRSPRCRRALERVADDVARLALRGRSSAPRVVWYPTLGLGFVAGDAARRRTARGGGRSRARAALARLGGSLVLEAAPPERPRAAWTSGDRRPPRSPLMREREGAPRPGAPARPGPLRRGTADGRGALADAAEREPRSTTASTAASACPPARRTESWGEEMDSPARPHRPHARARARARSRSTPTVAQHFDRCLGCMGCVTGLPVGRAVRRPHRGDARAHRGARRPRARSRPALPRAALRALPVPGAAAGPRRAPRSSTRAAGCRGSSARAGSSRLLPRPLAQLEALMPEVRLRSALTRASPARRRRAGRRRARVGARRRLRPARLLPGGERRDAARARGRGLRGRSSRAGRAAAARSRCTPAARRRRCDFARALIERVRAESRSTRSSSTPPAAART